MEMEMEMKNILKTFVRYIIGDGFNILEPFCFQLFLKI